VLSFLSRGIESGHWIDESVARLANRAGVTTTVNISKSFWAHNADRRDIPDEEPISLRQ